MYEPAMWNVKNNKFEIVLNEEYGQVSMYIIEADRSASFSEMIPPGPDNCKWCPDDN